MPNRTWLATVCDEHGWLKAHDGWEHTRGYCPIGDHTCEVLHLTEAEHPPLTAESGNLNPRELPAG